MPPKLIRRLVVAPLVVAAEAVLVIVSPALLLLALIASPLTGRGLRPLRVALIALSFTTRHMAALLACAGLWLAAGFGRRLRSEGIQQAHYDLLRWFVKGVYDTIEGLAKVKVRVFTSAPAGAMLTDKTRPALVFSRHAGEGDTLLVINELLVRHERHPHLVMHERLQLDPLIDLVGTRLPNRFVDPRGGDTERDIAAMARGLDEQSALIIFPEGRNFSATHRARAIEKLAEAGHHEEAELAEEMQHVAAPRPGGALAAIEANPQADVVVFAHVGFPTGLREVWRELPRPQTIDIRLWHEPAHRIPTDHDARIDWLFAQWRRMDAWVEEQTTLRALDPPH